MTLLHKALFELEELGCKDEDLLEELRDEVYGKGLRPQPGKATLWTDEIYFDINPDSTVEIK